jgi:30S ribosomal protein S31
MGKGDKRSAKGKRFKGSYGNSRPHTGKSTKAAADAKKAPKKS